MTRKAGPFWAAGKNPAAGFSIAGLSRGVAVAACLAAALAAFCLPIANPDLFWHMSAARWMAAHGAFPRADWLSHTMAGAPWSDFEWLTQLLFYGVFRLAGFTGLWLLKIGLYSTAAGLLWRVLGLYGIRPATRALGVLAWALAVSPANDLRPENFSLLLFLFLWGALEARRMGAPRRSFARRAVLTGAVFALWANLHAGFIYGLVLLGLFAAADAAQRRDGKLAGLGLIGAAAALINPYGVRVYTVAWEHWRVLPDLERFIREWQGASVLSPWLWPFWAVLAAAFAAVLARYLCRRDVPYPHLAALAVFGLSASSHVRTAIYFVSAAVPVTAAALAGFGLLERRRIARVFLLGVALAAVWGFFAVKVAPALAPAEVFSPAFVPRKLTHFLGRERDVLGGRRLLNPWHWGGYLGYELYPDYRVFVDGRYLFHSLLGPMYGATRDPRSYAGFLDSQGIEVAVVERTRQLQPMRVGTKEGGVKVLLRPFYIFFLPRTDWALVYWDAQGLVFVRRKSVPRTWLKTRELAHFRPGDLDAAALMLREGRVTREQLAAEIRRHAAAAGDAALAVSARRWLAGLESGGGK